MHICSEEILAAGSVLAFLPYCCRWCVYRVRRIWRKT